MSYTTMIIFRGGKPDEKIEFSNAWGSAARIWDALFNKHLKDPANRYDSWMSSGRTDALWDLWKRTDIPPFERAVLLSTLDRFYVGWVSFRRFAEDLRMFEAAYPPGGRVSHLPAWADIIDPLDAEAIGFHQSSVAENPWMVHDPDTGAETPILLTDGYEVYEELDKPRSRP